MASSRKQDDKWFNNPVEKHQRSFFRRNSPICSPIFGKKHLNSTPDTLNSTSSLASSRESSPERTQQSGTLSPNSTEFSSKFLFKQRFKVVRTSSFSDVDAIKYGTQSKRKLWMLSRASSIRLTKFGENKDEMAVSLPSSPEVERRHHNLRSALSRDHSLDRIQIIERRGGFLSTENLETSKHLENRNFKGFVHRWFRNITEPSPSYKSRRSSLTQQNNDDQDTCQTKSDRPMFDDLDERSFLSKAERLHLKDKEVTRALEEKQQLIAEILHIPYEDLKHFTNNVSLSPQNSDAKKVLLAALVQAKSLSDLVNSSLTLSKEDIIAADLESHEFRQPMKTDLKHNKLQGLPSDKLIRILINMNQHLTTLLAITQASDFEKEQLQIELQRSQLQLKEIMAQSLK